MNEKETIVNLLKKSKYLNHLKDEQIFNLIEVPHNLELGDFAFPCFFLSEKRFFIAVGDCRADHNYRHAADERDVQGGREDSQRLRNHHVGRHADVGGGYNAPDRVDRIPAAEQFFDHIP